MTKEELAKCRTFIPGLFSYGIDADCHKVSSPESGFSYEAGIPSSYSSHTGKKVCRGDINGLGRAVTQAKWFNQLGGYYTFDQSVSDVIGGYPLGAILCYKDEATGFIREVRSLIAENNYNFVTNPEFINDEYWSYVDNVPPSNFRPRIFPRYNETTTGKLAINQELFIPMPCVFMIQSGCNTNDCTDDGADFLMYLTVKRAEFDMFYTAGLICYLPAIASVLSQGILSDPRYSRAAEKLQTAFHAYNSPSPIQIYLSAGDTVKLSGNREFSKIENETWEYWITPLSA